MSSIKICIPQLYLRAWSPVCMDSNLYRSIKSNPSISGSRCVVSGGKCKIGGKWGWGCWIEHGPEAIPWLCWWVDFSCTHWKVFFFFVWKFIESHGSCWENSSIRCSSIHRGVPILTTMHTSKYQEKNRISYPSFERQCLSDTQNQFVSTKSQPECVFPTLSLV